MSYISKEKMLFAYIGSDQFVGVKLDHQLQAVIYRAREQALQNDKLVSYTGLLVGDIWVLDENSLFDLDNRIMLHNLEEAGGAGIEDEERAVALTERGWAVVYSLDEFEDIRGTKSRRSDVEVKVYNNELVIVATNVYSETTEINLDWQAYERLVTGESQIEEPMER